MKKFLLFTVLFLSFHYIKASHYSSGYVEAQYVGNITGNPYDYAITVYFIRDNAGATIGTSPQDIYILQCGNNSKTVSLSKRPASSNEASPNDNNGGFLLPNYGYCTGDPDAYSLHIYRDTINLVDTTVCYNTVQIICAPACCRASTNNLQTAPNLYLETVLNFSNGIKPSTLTPNFDKLIVDVCIAKPQVRSIFNPTSDSTSVTFTNAFEGLNPSLKSIIPYTSGFSVLNQLGTSSPISVDQGTKTLNFTANLAGTFNASLSLNKYAVVNGSYTIVSSAALDFPIKVSGSCVNEPWELRSYINPGDTILRVACGDQSIYIETNKRIDAASIAQDGSDFAVTNSLNNLLPVIASALENDSTLKLQLLYPISYNDTMNVMFRTGTDGNVIKDLCTEEIAEFTAKTLISTGCAGSVGISDELSQFNLYPNPVNATLNIEFENGATDRLALISNALGVIVKKVPINEALNQIDISSLSNGIYFISVKTEDQKSSKTFIKL